ncbi:MAG: GatB/YqeY domain-containing protein [Chloroflexi bacterium]|nr:GatB/YqeY domain-containing protein [Chloroflexota bacterium]MDA1002647.1 GatB/YqeY domain-containing protein [Chloroflexota bacterium]MQC27547.1 GatB/YqeY domain-containing protein [Chloroflexota bacterium]
MAGIPERVRADMTAAMKAREASLRDTLRLLVAALDNARIAAGHPLDDDEAVRALQREARQRRDSIAEYRKANREDLAAREDYELGVIETYLPQALGEDDLKALARATIEEVGAAGPGDLGKVMGPLMARIAGRADGKRANEIVRELLTG